MFARDAAQPCKMKNNVSARSTTLTLGLSYLRDSYLAVANAAHEPAAYKDLSAQYPIHKTSLPAELDVQQFHMKVVAAVHAQPLAACQLLLKDNQLTRRCKTGRFLNGK